MAKRTIKAIISDFDGVLCSDYFYHTLEKKLPDVYDLINLDLFKENRWMVKDWMRGKINSRDINKYLADKTSLSEEFLNKELERSVEMMKLNSKLVNFIRNTKKKGIKTALLTDNMDVFEKITIPNKNLGSVFDFIIPSFKYGKLKGDDNGGLLDVARELLGVSFEEILVLDDWDILGDFVKARNSNFYLYNKNTMENFDKWFFGQFTI